MQDRNFARLADPAQSFERAMHRGERDVRMQFAHRRVDLLSARMINRSEQRLDDRKPLRRYRKPTPLTARRKFVEAMPRVLTTTAIVDYPRIHNG